MSGSLEVGMEATHDFEVDGRLLTDVGGTLGTEVLSTPGMIAMMERTSAMLVYPALDDGKATVGFEVNVRHVGAAQSDRNVALWYQGTGSQTKGSSERGRRGSEPRSAFSDQSAGAQRRLRM